MKNKTLLQAFALLFILGLMIFNLPLIVSYSLESMTESQAPAMVGICDEAFDEEKCYTEQFSKIVAQFPLAYTMDVLRRVQKLDARADGCHFIGHVIGAEEMKKHSEGWENAIAKLPITQCTGGFLMGALEERKQSDATFVINAKTIPKICNKVLNTTKVSGSDQTCVHTSGHLLLIEETGRVPRAIAECSNLPQVFLYECASGVFMENIYRRNLHAHGIGLPLAWNTKTLEEQQQYCGEFEGIQSQACWREISHMFVVLAERNPQKIYALCDNAPEQLAKDACYLHAVSVMLLTAREDEKDSGDLCKPFAERRELKDRCMQLEKQASTESL